MAERLLREPADQRPQADWIDVTGFTPVTASPSLSYSLPLCAPPSRALRWNRHPGLDPGSTFSSTAGKKVDAGSSPA
jgi:hypothetical protein